MKPVVLMILDGYGIGLPFANAIETAKTPKIDELFKKYSHTLLGASGLEVGLPKGQMGNSEVGHSNIGAGRVVYQELTRITKAIEEETFFENKVLVDAVKNVKTLHLMGLLSDGGVHSHIEHLFALLKLADNYNVKKVCVHSFLDGRDTDPKGGILYLNRLNDEVSKYNNAEISTVTGRYFAMDRDNRFERVKKGYDATVNAIGCKSLDMLSSLQKSYDENITDEFVEPIVNSAYEGVNDGDAVIFYNFRPDRAREITRTIVDHNFEEFETKKFALSSYVCMTQYDASMPNVKVAFTPQSLANTLGEVVEDNNKIQLRIAETEKYAHVTFFFNGGREDPLPHEDRILVPSPKVATYDLKPEMSAYEVTEKLSEAIDSEKHDLIVVNYANCDMVGHTGDFDAAIKAVETVDSCVGVISDAVLAKGGVILLTADHGNADIMKNEDLSPMTAHTVNPVPFITVGLHKPLRNDGILADIAPTILELLSIDVPIEMTGKSLIC